MTRADSLFLISVGAIAGVVSTVVSLASLVSYPALLAIGLPPVAANVTNTVSLVFTGVGSAAGSRPELTGQGGRVLRLGVLTAMGGATGAALLLLTPPRWFEKVAPLLVAGASALLLLQPRLSGTAVAGGHERSRVLRAALFGVAIYVGYFGAAGGILVLVVLGAMLDQPLVRINAIKNAVSGLANAVAAIGFIAFGPVRWAAVAPLAAGFLVGGLVGPLLVRRLPGQSLRVLVGGLGLAVSLKLGFDTYP